MPPSPPLTGLRVLTFENFGAGPFGSMYLADLGAEVIKIENREQGGDATRSMGPFFLGEVRGQGQGRRLLQHCIEAARRLGYRHCYLETLTGMDAAQHLYVTAGFTALCGPLGATGHFACDRYFVLEL